MNRKPGEFPPRPITQTVVDEEAGWDWHKGACQICGGEALKCDERSPLLLKVACPTCQRYTLEPEAANQLKATSVPGQVTQTASWIGSVATVRMPMSQSNFVRAHGCCSRRELS